MTRTRRTVTVERLLATPAGAVFAVLASPDAHAALDGSGTLRGEPSGPERLHLGARFSMAMQQGRLRYRSVNVVTEFDEGRVLAWRTAGEWRGRTLVGGHVRRWELLPRDGGTIVRHSYEWGRARFATPTLLLLGHPPRAARTMPGSLERLAGLLAG